MKSFNNNLNLACLAAFCLLIMTGCSKMKIQDDLAGFDPDGDMGYFNVLLKGPGQASGERILDVGNGQLYTLEQASEVPEKIDFLTLWDPVSGMNIVAPVDMEYLAQWEDGQTVNANWHVKNTTNFIKLDASDSHLQLFASIASAEDVKAAYAQAREEVVDQEDYDIAQHGPGLFVQQISEGDLILMETDKGVYAAALVQNVNAGAAGSLRLSVKVDKRSYSDVPPLDPSEVMDIYETQVEQPGAIGGLRYLDFSTGETYLQSNVLFYQGAIYHQEKIDMVLFNATGLGSYNFVSPDNDERLAEWPGAGQEIIDRWQVRNSSHFIKLESSESSHALFSEIYNNTGIRNAYHQTLAELEADPNYEPDGRGPGKYINEVELGDVILFKSETKNIYAIAQVISHAPGDDGHVRLSVKVDNSAQQYVAPAPLPEPVGEVTELHVDFYGASNNPALIDLANATLHLEADAEQHPGDIDMAILEGLSTRTNFNVIANRTGFDWVTALRGRIDNWSVKNDGAFIRLEAGPAANALFDQTDSRYDDLKETFEKVAKEKASVPHLTLVDTDQVIFFRSISRDFYAVMKMVNVTKQGNNVGELTMLVKVGLP
ncbi:hypothetical protein G5B30_00720 [Sphingobacterium sp. SGG-5]|uniref:hypothetical protein n=1 Tax=Sphingobacterium sp. SGG-5 TaxID=2710881 RepID=UPI0013EC44A1|nr:hypothetical protein [Sphingobacterium sp. SGG-5]NGM60426.1 hypothetical protein [Sphingobacterium sp. SGG-5]